MPSFGSVVLDSAANSPAVLISWHKMGEASVVGPNYFIADSSGNNRDGSVNPTVLPTMGNPALIVGDPATCFEFPGNFNSFFGVQLSTVTNLAGGSIWFRLPTVTGSYQNLIDRDDGVHRCFQFRVTPTAKLEFLWWTTGGTGPTVLTGTTTLAANTVYRASFGIDSSDSKMRVYLNGVLEVGPSAATDLAALSTVGVVGARGQSAVNQNLTGRVGHLTLYSAWFLSPARELAHYNAGITVPLSAGWGLLLN